MKTLEQNIAEVLPELADAMSKPPPSLEWLKAQADKAQEQAAEAGLIERAEGE